MWLAPLFHHVPLWLQAERNARSAVNPAFIRFFAQVYGRFHCRHRTISIYTAFPKNCCAVIFKLLSSTSEYASMISSMERNTHKPANRAGLVNSFLCFICLPLSLIKNTRNSAASLLLSAAIAQTVTQAMLATSKRLAMARDDSCCHDSK